MFTASPVNNNPTMICDVQVAQILGVSTQTLHIWRRDGKGPRSFKLGDGIRAPVRYLMADIAEFLASSASRSGAL